MCGDVGEGGCGVVWVWVWGRCRCEEVSVGVRWYGYGCGEVGVGVGVWVWAWRIQLLYKTLHTVVPQLCGISHPAYAENNEYSSVLNKLFRGN